MKRHEPGPPLLFTMIMKAMVMPRTTSSESSRCTPDRGAIAGLLMVGAVAVLVISAGVSLETRIALNVRARGRFRQGAALGARGYHGQAWRPAKVRIYSSCGIDSGKTGVQVSNT